VKVLSIRAPVLFTAAGYTERRARHAEWTELNGSGFSYAQIAALYGVRRDTVRHGIDAFLNRQPRIRRSA
jgi:hypothetical protein